MQSCRGLLPPSGAGGREQIEDPLVDGRARAARVDRLDADVRGAQPLGIYAIWITRRAKILDPTPFSPDYSVKTLSEIPPLLLSL